MGFRIVIASLRRYHSVDACVVYRRFGTREKQVMSLDLDRIRNGCLGFLAIVLALFVIATWHYSRNSDAPENTDIDRIRKMSYTNPVEALARCVNLIGQTKDKAERAALEHSLPQLQNLAFLHYLKDNQTDDAKRILDQLLAANREPFIISSARRAWAESLASRARQASQAGKDAEAEALFAGAFAQYPGQHPSETHNLLEAYRKMKISQWRKCLEGNPPDSAAAMNALNDAASVVDLLLKDASRGHQLPATANPHRHAPSSSQADEEERDLIQALLDIWQSPGTLQATGSNLMKQNKPCAAFACFRSAQEYMKAPDPAKSLNVSNTALPKLNEELNNQACRSLLQIADEARAGRMAFADSDSARACYLMASQRSAMPSPMKFESLTGLIDVDCERFMAQWNILKAIDDQRLDELANPPTIVEKSPDNLPMPPEYSQLRYQAESAFSDLNELHRQIFNSHLPDLWSIKTADLEFNPWPEVPTNLAARIEKEKPKATEQARRRALEQFVREGLWSPAFPQTAPITAILPEYHARRAVLEFDGNRNLGLQLARMVLRNYPDSDNAKRIRSALEAALRKTSAGKDMDGVFAFTGFYVSEVGAPQQGTPFYTELRSILDKSIADLKEESPMRRIFLLAVKADLFPNDASGRDARTQAIDLGLKTVKRLNPDLPEKKHDNLPSGLKDRSVLATENATEYHLLFFFDGPEKFLARISPYRKASVVVKDGRYIIAVISTSDDIVPYRSQGTFTSNFVEQRYVIQQPGASGSSWPGGFRPESSAMGDYFLLRAPPDDPAPTLNPKTGAIVQ